MVFMFIWYIIYLVALAFGITQFLKGNPLKWRDMLFFFMGFGLSFIPLYYAVFIN